MTQKFFVPGQLPGLNEIIAAAKRRHNGWNGYALLKQEWGAIIQYEIKRAQLKPMSCARIHYYWQERNARRDLDNISGAGRKLINDALVKAGILPNDGWKQIMAFEDEFAVVKDEPGVWVTLR